MAKIEYLNYDRNVDHLTIYKAKGKIASSINTGLSIISFNKKKTIVGFEFMGAHKNFKIPLEVLNHMKGCKLSMRYNPLKKVLIVTLFIKYEKTQQPLIYTYENMDLGKTAYNNEMICSAAA